MNVKIKYKHKTNHSGITNGTINDFYIHSSLQWRVVRLKRSNLKCVCTGDSKPVHIRLPSFFQKTIIYTVLTSVFYPPHGPSKLLDAGVNSALLHILN